MYENSSLRDLGTSVGLKTANKESSISNNSDKKKHKMQVRSGVKLAAVAVVFVALFGHNLEPVEGQFFNALANLFRPLTRVFRPRFHDDGTQSPQATGRDEILPSDCGRDPDKGTGKLCFPDGLLCQQRKFLFLSCESKSDMIYL